MISGIDKNGVYIAGQMIELLHELRKYPLKIVSLRILLLGMLERNPLGFLSDLSYGQGLKK